MRTEYSCGWISRSRMKILPAVGARTPVITLIRVDLPAPLSPMRPTISLRPIAMSMSRSAWTAPKNFWTAFQPHDRAEFGSLRRHSSPSRRKPVDERRFLIQYEVSPTLPSWQWGQEPRKTLSCGSGRRRIRRKAFGRKFKPAKVGQHYGGAVEGFVARIVVRPPACKLASRTPLRTRA